MKTNETTATQLGKFNPLLDTIGLITSGICALHCALLPVILTFTPLVSLSFFDSPLFVWIMIGISLCLASTSFLTSYYKHHRNKEPLILMLFAFILLVIGQPSEPETLFSSICMVIGGVLMAYAHHRNWKLCNEKNIKFVIRNNDKNNK